MLKFFKEGAEFMDLTRSMNGLYGMLQELIPRIEENYDYSEFKEDILVLSYFARKGILDRMEKYNWSMERPIYVPSIKKGNITLLYAFSQTVQKLATVASEIGYSDLYEEVLNRGEAYYEVEKILPPELAKDM
jgi:hypothetical protein